jgi:hypothetical protein
VLVHHTQFHAYNGQNSRISERVKSYFYNSNSSFIAASSPDNTSFITRDEHATVNSGLDVGNNDRSKLELILTNKSSSPKGTNCLNDTMFSLYFTYL